jgi:hypothetical protein
VARHTRRQKENKNKIGQKLITGTSAHSNVVSFRVITTALPPFVLFFFFAICLPLSFVRVIIIIGEYGIGENRIGEKLCTALHALRNIAYIII